MADITVKAHTRRTKATVVPDPLADKFAATREAIKQTRGAIRRAQASASEDRLLESILAEAIERDASDDRLVAEIDRLRSGIPVIDHVAPVEQRKRWPSWVWRW